MDATSLQTAGLAAPLAPASTSPTPDAVPDAARTGKGFWQALASATDANPDDSVPVPPKGKDDKQTDLSASAIAAWVPPVLVAGLPLPITPTEVSTDATGPRIFGSPAGVIPAQLSGLPAVGVAVTGFDLLAISQAQASQSNDGARAAGDVPAAGETLIPSFVPITLDQPAVPPSIPVPLVAPSPAEQQSGEAVTAGTNIGIPFELPLAGQAAPPEMNVGTPIDISLASQAAAAKGFEPAPAAAQAPATADDQETAPKPAAIAARIAVASGQTTAASQSVAAQAAQAALAARGTNDVDVPAPTTPLLRQRERQSEGTSFRTGQLSTASEVPSPQPSPIAMGEGITRARLDFRVTDDGVEPSAYRPAPTADGFPSVLGAAGAAGANAWAPPITIASAGSQSLHEIQSHALVEQVVQQASLLRFPDRTEMTVDLSPPHLGAIHLHLTQSSGAFTVQMRADDPQVQQMLAGNIEQLTNRLHEQGHAVSVDLSGDRQAPREAPDQSMQGDGSARQQADPGPTSSSTSDEGQPRRSTDRRVDYRA